MERSPYIKANHQFIKQDQPTTVIKKVKPIKIVKKGLLIGINYNESSSQLNGCINDTENLAAFLISKKYFKKEDLVMMGDNQKDDLYPTKANIMNQLNKLVQFANTNHDKQVQLFLSYSGHGYYLKDSNGDEDDGMDEVLCPVDYNVSGYIKDDDLKRYFINMLPENVKLVCLMDCCHSGSILDLKYQYVISGGNDSTYKMYDTMEDTKCEVVMVSGCKDDQTSADAYIRDELEGGTEYQGAMTAAWIRSYTEHVSNNDLVKNMRKWLADNRYTQIPQLSSGKYRDIQSIYILDEFN